MLLLRCAILGQRSVFTMEVNENWIVGIFMNELQAKGMYDFLPCMLRLFIAQPIDGPHSAWLKTSDADYEALAREDARVTTAYMDLDRGMYGGCLVSDYFPCQPDKHVHNIHVLVKLPTEEEVASPSSWILGRRMAEKAAKEEKAKKAKTPATSDEEVGLFHKWIVAPLRDFVASLAAWILPLSEEHDIGMDAEKQKPKAT